MSQPSTRWAYVAAICPVIFGTTYLLTTQFLPPGRPLLSALMRSLPTGVVLVLATRAWPPRGWWGRFILLSVMYCSAFFPLLFIAAYLLPGGVASVINSITPLIVVVLSVPLLHTKIRTIDIVAGGLGILGVGLLVLRSTAQLDGWGILAMTTCVIMMGFSTVLTNRAVNPFLKVPMVGFYGNAKIKRSDFGLTQYPAVIADEVELSFALELLQKP